MKIGCIVMAAGNARRFGSNKLDARVEGKTLLRRALEAVPVSCFTRVAVVTQYPQGMELAREMGVKPTSVRMALTRARKKARAMLRPELEKM